MKPGTVGAVIVGVAGVAAAGAVFLRDGAQLARAHTARDRAAGKLAGGDAQGASPAYDEALTAAMSVGGLTGRRTDALLVADDARRGLALCRALGDPDPRALARALGPGGTALGAAPAPAIEAMTARARADLLLDAGLALEAKGAISQAPALLKAAVEAARAAGAPRLADGQRALVRAELRHDLEEIEQVVSQGREDSAHPAGDRDLDPKASTLAGDLRGRLATARDAFTAVDATALDARLRVIVLELDDRIAVSRFEEQVEVLGKKVPSEELGGLRAAAAAVTPPLLAGGHPDAKGVQTRLDKDVSRLEDIRKAAAEFADMLLLRKSGSTCLFIDRTEVTNEAFARFVADGGYTKADLWSADAQRALESFVDQTGRPGPKTWHNGAPAPGRERHPVVGVSFDEAEAYAKWAGKRLPTADEWRAAAAPDGKPYPWGDAWKDGLANVKTEGGPGDTRPVGELPGGASTCGALDMIGNARELVAGPGGKPLALGGSFLALPAQATVQAALEPSARTRAADTGFRCVRDLTWN